MNKTLAYFYLLHVIYRWVDDKQFPQMAYNRQLHYTNKGQQYDGLTETMDEN
jgi:hypothetical protein